LFSLQKPNNPSKRTLAVTHLKKLITSGRFKSGQEVSFENNDGDIECGKIARLHEDGTCDIQHNRDREIITKNVEQCKIKAKPLFSRQERFVMQSKVCFINKKGKSHNGIITKIHKDNTYNIQHESDAERETTNVQAHNISSRNGISSFISSKMTKVKYRKGASVKFRMHDECIEGVIENVRSNGTYNISYVDKISGEKKIANKLRRDELELLEISSASNYLSSVLSKSFEPAEGMAVEVISIDIESGSKSHKVGKLAKKYEDGTFSVRYGNGKVEKRINSNRLRVVDSQLRIGAKVNVIFV